MSIRERPVGARPLECGVEPVYEQQRRKRFLLKPLTAVTVNRQAGVSLRRGADDSLNLGGNADFIRPKYNKRVMLGAFFIALKVTGKTERKEK